MKDSTKQLNNFLIQKFLSLGIHLGSKKTLWDPSTKVFLKGFRKNFCIIEPNLTFLYFRRAVIFLRELILSRKKILFLGTPIGLEKEFSQLCLKYNHFIVEKDIQGFFTNYNLIFQHNTKSIPKIKNRPALVFVFSPSENLISLKEILKLNFPIMGFVNSSDKALNLDFPIPGNINSQKGSFFLYNLFLHLFKLSRLVEKRKVSGLLNKYKIENTNKKAKNKVKVELVNEKSKKPKLAGKIGRIRN
jgi:ribosomal protein S2